MVRVAGLRAQVEAGVLQRTPDGRSPSEQIGLIRPVVEALTERQRRCWCDDLMPQLGAHGIAIKEYADLSPSQRARADAIFESEVFPVLTPLAFDPGHPFPHISNLSLNLAVAVQNKQGQERFARIKMPEVLPRLISLASPDSDTHVFVWLEQLIAANLPSMFPGMEVREAYPFRVTRNADIDIQEEEAADLLRTIEYGLQERHFGPAVRLEVDATMSARILAILTENMDIGSDDVYTHSGPLGLHSVLELLRLDRPDLKYPPFVPNLPRALAVPEEIFAAILEQDRLLHHPYDSFLPVVEFVRAAAEDPQVLAMMVSV
jgi:polyphosphate kinase